MAKKSGIAGWLVVRQDVTLDPDEVVNVEDIPQVGWFVAMFPSLGKSQVLSRFSSFSVSISGPQPEGVGAVYGSCCLPQT